MDLWDLLYNLLVEVGELFCRVRSFWNCLFYKYGKWLGCCLEVGLVGWEFIFVVVGDVFGVELLFSGGVL